MKAKLNHTIVKYDKDSTEVTAFGLVLVDKNLQEKKRKEQSRVITNMQNKPKNMYRWGEVVDSSLLPQGTRVYYSRFDAETFDPYDSVPNKYLLAYEEPVN